MLFLCAGIGLSQKTSISGVKRYSSRGLGVIKEDNQVKGYYFFYLKDKVSRELTSYGLYIYNNNLEATHNIEFTKPKNSMLLESSYNGDRLCFSFVNQKLKTLELDMYDNSGKLVSTYSVKDVSPAELNYYVSMVQSEEDEFNGSLMAVPGKGFIRYGMEKEGGYRTSIEFIDNNGKKAWATEPFSKEKKSYETTEPVFANENVAVTNISVRPKLMSSDIDYNMVVHEISSGKELFKFPLIHDKGHLVMMGMNYDAAENQYLLYGEYYGKTGNGRLDVKNKQGFFVQVYDKNGKLVKENFSSWEKDIAAIIPVASKGRMENDAIIFVHNVIKTADGNYFAIGEEFKKKVSGRAMLVNAAGGEAALMEIQMMNMVVFQFDKDLKPVKAYIIEKKKSHILLQKGMSTVSPHKLGYIMKLYGYFDYAFTTESNDKSTFNSVYINYARDKENDSNLDVGTIYYKDKEIAVDHVKLNTRPSSFKIIPAKSGYITILEYQRKTKTVELRLEKLDI